MSTRHTLTAALLAIAALLCAPALTAQAHTDVLADWLALPELAPLATLNARGELDPFYKLYQPADPLARRLLAQAGALWLEGRDAPVATRILTQALLARALWLNGEPQAARSTLAEALDLADAAGWDARASNGLLRDQARYASEPVATLDAAIAACPAPCDADRVALQARTLQPQATAAPSLLRRTHGAVAFAERHYPNPSTALADFLRDAGSQLEEVRPWDALDHYLRALDQLRRLDPAPLAHLDLEVTIAELMLRNGDYPRLALFADPLLREVATHEGALDHHQWRAYHTLLRTRARGRRQQFSNDQAEVYGAALGALERRWNRNQARALLTDLFDTDLTAPTEALLERLLQESPDNTMLLAMQARRAHQRGDSAQAVGLTQRQLERLTRLGGDPLLPALQRQLAAYQGQSSDAACPGDAYPNARLLLMIELRDHGAFEAAACLAQGLAENAIAWAARGEYRDAQTLWQLAYTHARVGDTERAFALMQQAAGIAARRSFAAIESTSGGSLQLLKRDRWRYLLFLDIAWAARTGERPQSLSITSRY